MNKSSVTKTSKENNYGAANAGNNKNKRSKQNKKYQQSNANSNINKKNPRIAPTADRIVTL